MPEYPDVELYLHSLRIHLCKKQIESVVVKSPFLLRTYEIDIDESHGKTVQAVSRIGKRIVWHLDDDLFLVFHLMISGRYHMRKPQAFPASKMDLAAFRFNSFTIMLTEAASKKRASLDLVRGSESLSRFQRGGLEVMNCSVDEFSNRLREKNRTVKLALIDPVAFDGIGNAYSDEILHAARLSPFARTANMTANQVQTLYQSVRQVLSDWRARLIEQAGDKFPEKVTAFRPEMSVHGKFGEPCPVCNKKVQRIRFSEKEWNYCAQCQTNGKLLADRSLSRLLKDEWPTTINDVD